jgi:hypothetical protein
MYVVPVTKDERRQGSRLSSFVFRQHNLFRITIYACLVFGQRNRAV